MNHPHEDAPRLPEHEGRDIAGSLADHVRQFATDDPEQVAVRDELASMADRDIPHRGVPVIDRRASRQTLDETLPEPPAPDDTFDLIPPGVDRVLTKGGLLAQYTSGGMWTVTMPGGRRVQRGHGEFVHNEGPFRVPPELVPEQDDSPE